MFVLTQGHLLGILYGIWLTPKAKDAAYRQRWPSVWKRTGTTDLEVVWAEVLK